VSDIIVANKTQAIVLSGATTELVLNRKTTQNIIVDAANKGFTVAAHNTQRIVVDQQNNVLSVVLSGPVGPPGLTGEAGVYDLAPVIIEIDSRIATHNGQINALVSAIADASVIYVYHGAVGNTTRPVNAAVVTWVGSATPANATVSTDIWIDTT
jgi:hypothetical protein